MSTAAEKLSRYPAAYSKILLAIPAGRSLEFKLQSAEAAQAERLKFYNFLKFLKRPCNRVAAAHFNGRERQVRIIVKENILTFSLEAKGIVTDLDYALDAAIQGGSVLNVDLPFAVAEPEVPEMPAEVEEQINPLDILNNALKEQNDGL